MTEKPHVKIKILRDGAVPPGIMSAHSAGADLSACIGENIDIGPGEWRKIPTGLSFEIPAGFEGEIRPRSGLAAKYGITLLNSPGTIDADYRGEVNVIVVNHGKGPFTIANGDRIAQILIRPISRAEFEIVEELTETTRGEGGFGSSGR